MLHRASYCGGRLGPRWLYGGARYWKGDTYTLFQNVDSPVPVIGFSFSIHIVVNQRYNARGGPLDI